MTLEMERRVAQQRARRIRWAGALWLVASSLSPQLTAAEEPVAGHAAGAPGPSAAGAPSPNLPSEALGPSRPQTPPSPLQPPVGPLEPAKPARTTPAVKVADVKLHDAVVFEIGLDRKQQSAAMRARSASHALERAFDSGRSDVRIEALSDARVIYVADTPVIELFPEDAQFSGNTSVDVHAARAAARIREVFESERKRSDIAATVFSISLVVFFGFIALYVLRRIGELATRAREFLQEHPERIGAIRLNRVQVIGAGPVRALLIASVLLGRWVLQIGVVYIWLLLSLSRFELTRPYTSQLTSLLLGPLSSLAQRALTALPLGLLTLVFAIGVYVSMRFIELYFAGVTRGQERASWLPRDLVTPTSALVRVAVLLLALIFAGPTLTGDPESVLAKLGSMVLLALALASTPLLCSVVLGVVAIFSRRLRVGRLVELGGQSGRVITVGLLDVLLRDDHGRDVRVPHLLSLLRPARLHSVEPRLWIELAVSPEAEPQRVQQLLLAIASEFGSGATSELIEIDADAARYAVSVLADATRGASELRIALVEALRREQIALGRRRPGGAA
jgi:small-conductance mechanosensitive channel